MNKESDSRINRNSTDDLIRLISVVFVIMIHADNKPWDGIPVLDGLITSVIFFSNSFFYMLSGKYSIGMSYSTPQDYARYYKKKLVGVLFPYVFVSMILSIWNLFMFPDLDIGSTPVFVYYLKFSLKELFSENNSTHLWFMFGLMGYLVSAPFLSKMFQSMSDSELHIVFGIGIFWNVVTVLIFPFLYKQFCYSGWFMAGWIIHFCLGYYIDRVVKPDNAKWFYLVGVLGLLANVLGMTYGSNRFRNSTDLAPTFILACVGAMALLQQKVVVKSETIKRITAFASKYTFLLYMVHYNIIHYVTPIITESIPKSVRYASDVVVTIVLSLACSFVLGIVIIPLQKVLRRMLAI